jgi:hypothetical protein
MLTSVALEQTNSHDDGQKADDSDARWETAPVHRETISMRSESDAGCEQDHGPVNPFGIKPRQPERRQRREHHRENSTVHRAGKRRTHAGSIQDSDGFYFTLLHAVTVPLTGTWDMT